MTITATTEERNPLVASILLGDCRELLAAQDADSLDSCVCDPPYEIGFMGKQWDASGIAFDPATWAAVLRVLKPGAHLLAFGGARSNHRMVCAIEDAGFEIRDSVSWCYASGFPKNKLCQLKPAQEPIVLARKPLSEPNILANVERWGTGALNIDACRIGRAAGDVPGWHKTGANGTGGYQGSDTFRTRDMDAAEIQERCGGGRWPANLILNHTLFCEHIGAKRVRAISGGTGEASKGSGGRHGWTASNTGGKGDADGLETVDAWECAPGCPVALLDAQSGHSEGDGPRPVRRSKSHRDTSGGWGMRSQETAGHIYGDSGGASRFFHCLPWDPLDERVPPFLYAAKPAKSERNHGCDTLPTQTRHRVNPGGLEHDPRWAPTQVKNHHPTVKPVSLLRLLVRLVTPAGGTVLDCFSGSGTTGVAAMREGYGFFGMEQHAPYVEIGRARLAAERSLFAETDAP